MIEEIGFAHLKRKDEIEIETRSSKLRITVTGKRKDGLRVQVRMISKSGEQEKFTAKMPDKVSRYGGPVPGVPGVIKIGCPLYFESLERQNGLRDGALRTTPIKKITLIST